MFFTYPESIWPDSSNHAYFGSLQLSWAEHSLFKDAKMIPKKISGAKNILDLFLQL